MSACALTSERKPSRIIAWSSAKRIRKVLTREDLLFRGGRDGDARARGRARVRRVEVESAADQHDPLPHPQQSEAAPRPRRERNLLYVKPSAVVFDDDDRSEEHTSELQSRFGIS